VDAIAKVLDDKNQSEEVRGTACAALARIGDVRAVPMLTKFYYKGEKGLTKVFRIVPASIRAAAARALAAFPAHKEARDALRAAKDDHDPAVRAVANQALYAPLQEAFGERALAVQVVSGAGQVMPGTKAGGTMQEIGFDAIIERLGAIEATGLLAFNFNGPLGKLWFDAGLIVAAEFESRRDQEAVLFMSGKREGHVLFHPGEGAPDRRMLLQAANLLAELRSRGGSGTDSALRPPS